MRIKVIIPILLVIILITYIIYHFNLFQQRIELGDKVTVSKSNNNEKNKENPIQNKQIKIVEVVKNIDIPWSIVFTEENRFLFSERNGDIHEVINDQVNTTPLITLKTATNGEIGLMGLEVDPEYANGQEYIYACIGYDKDGVNVNRVSKFQDRTVKLVEDSVLIDNIPSARFHAGCRLKFAPDGTLFITTGDALDPDLAQNIDSLAGKILRINKDGTIPIDNPIANSPIYSLGHRNPQGIDFHPTENYIVSTEHGPSGFDGRGGGDEVNIIVAGENYGWPIVSHLDKDERFIDPLLVFTPAEAPASGTFYNADLIPQFKNNYFFGALRGEGIFRIKFVENSTNVDFYEKLKEINVGRIREITVSPNGEIYFSTSNTDGRGDVNVDDDKIFKITTEE